MGEAVLGSRLTIVELSDMKHGWTTRGDISEEKVKMDVGKAIKRTVEHFEKYLTKSEGNMQTELTNKLPQLFM